MTTEKERIEEVAIRTASGEVYRLPSPCRHSDVTMEMAASGELLRESTKGFITSTGRFVDRHEGYRIAFAAGQLLHREDMTPEILYSEDLW